MPRPRVVKVKKGTVTIRNLSKAEGDDIERFLTTPMKDRREVVFNEDKFEWEIVENKDPFWGMDLSQTALSLFSDETGYYAVEISYDPKSEMGKVTSKKFLHQNINHARLMFDQIFGKKFL